MAVRNRHRKPSSSVVQHKAASVAVTAGIGLAVPLLMPGSASASNTSAWDKIAECESNGRWNLGYGDASSTGGLQIQKPTWDDYGGREFAPQPHQATKEQQIAVAERILKGQGPKAWTCNAKTGYPLNGLVGKKGSKAPSAAPENKPPVPRQKAPEPRPKSETEPGAQSGKQQQKPAAGSSGTYTVRSGDTLHEISVRHGSDGNSEGWRGLYEANRSVIGSDPDLIRVGQVLKVSGQSQQAPKPQQQAPKPQQQVSKQQHEAPKPQQEGTARVNPLGNVQGKGYGPSARYGSGQHTGSDFTAPQGTKVKAAAGGKVIASDNSPAYGVNVRIQHPDGTYTLYAHLSGKSVQAGADVKAGQLIGYVGSTGNSTGPHLHFEVRTQPEYRKGGFLDPMAWLAKNGR